MDIKTISFNEIEPEPINWLWPGYLPLGKLVTLDGDPGTSKTTFAIDIAARITRGAPMPLEETAIRSPGRVLFLSAEDGLADTLRPRLEAANADINRVFAPQLTSTGRLPTLPDDIGEFQSMIFRLKPILVILDPLAAFLSANINSHRDSDIRRALFPVSLLAGNTGATVLIIRHLNKMPGTSAMYRGGGSIGIIGAARAAFLVGKAPDESDDRILAPIKSNLSRLPRSIRYRTIDKDGVPQIEWLDYSDYSADQLVGNSPSRKQGGRVLNHAKTFLQGALANGPIASTELDSLTEAQGISKRTLDRAKKDLGIKSTKRGFNDGRWYSSLSGQEEEDRHPDPTRSIGSLRGEQSDEAETGSRSGEECQPCTLGQLATLEKESE